MEPLAVATSAEGKLRTGGIGMSVDQRHFNGADPSPSPPQLERATFRCWDGALTNSRSNTGRKFSYTPVLSPPRNTHIFKGGTDLGCEGSYASDLVGPSTQWVCFPRPYS